MVETEASNKHLVEEDQDASDDEDEKRISFSGVKNKTQRQKIAEEIGTVVQWCSVWEPSPPPPVPERPALTRAGIEGSDDEALDTGQDEELSRWEQEQIRKGISIPQVRGGGLTENHHRAACDHQAHSPS